MREVNKAKFDKPDIYFAFLLKHVKGELKIDSSELSQYRWVQLD